MLKSKSLTLLYGLALTTCYAQQYTISTVAGGAPPPTPITATSASIGHPHNAVADSAGNVYFSSGNCVYKLSTTGSLSVFAGNSRAGYSGDAGPAVNAQLNLPAGLAFDSSGDLYIADSQNNVIRIVTPDGNINTFAGTGTAGYTGDSGPAYGGGASLNNPLGVAVDKKGNVYIADNLNHAIREVSGGIINTFVGLTGWSFGYSGDGGPANQAQIYLPTDITVDSSGNIYICDFGNYVIRQVTTDGNIHTYAGNNADGYAGDGGAATSASLSQPYGIAVDSSGNLYISEQGDARIRKVLTGSGGAGGKISTIAGNGTLGFTGDGSTATSAELNNPDGLCVDSSGNLYIADWANNRLRKITSSGSISTAAGNGILSYSGDGGSAVKAQLGNPSGVAVDASGNLYVVDTGNNVVRQVSAAGVISTFAGTGTAGFSGDGSAANKAQLSAPQGVAVDAAGNVYIADSANYRVRVVAPNGNISTFAGNGTPAYAGDNGPAASASFTLPAAVAADKSGNVYIADLEYGVVRKVSNGTITTVAGSAAGTGYSGDGGPATKAQLNNPAGIAVDLSGNLYIAQIGDSRVRMVSNGIINTIAGDGSNGYTGENQPAIASELASPNGVVADAYGNVFISQSGNRIMKVGGDGSLNTIAGTGTPGYSGDGGSATAALLNIPSAIAMDAKGNLYFSESGNNAVRKLTIAGYGNSISAITNGASGQTGAIAPGEIVVVYGSGLGPNQLTLQQVNSNNVVTSALAGTRILFNGTPAPILYTTATQVSAVVPFGLTGSTAQVIAQNGDQTSQPFSVPVASVSPALFTADSSGQGQALAMNADGTNNSAANPASAGSVITLFATGLGAMTPSTPDGTILFPPLPKTSQTISVTIGGQSAAVQSSTGVTNNVAGSVQIQVQIPAGISAGAAVPVVIQAGGATSPAGVTIATAP